MTSTELDSPATKRDLQELGIELRNELTELRTELQAEFRSEIGQLRSEMYGELGPMRQEIAANRAAIQSLRNELLLEIGAAASRTANVVIEHMRDMLRVFDDRYRDLPGRVAALEAQVQRHVADDERHR